MTSTEGALWCVVPAAGRGARFGGELPKQYRSIAGTPMLLLTLERLAAHPRIGGIVVVLARNDPHWPGQAEIGGKLVLIAEGGEERADSVLAGLYTLRTEVAPEDFVLVHDAARPCVRAADISRLIDAGMPAGGALLAAPLRDTLKRADAEGRVAATEPRETRWRALTPQLFRHGELVAALESAHAAGVAVTDEAMAMECAGHRPLLVAGSDDNIKVTTPADLLLAESILRHA
ncbi:MAG TPA: 2-C-methyl-D-erythritol 4-phosphate cytidylyltransferase [Rudaea sp.]|nr:2-C-methyl-D-erythritol 4-phosphate cytidylyltransferase [Rudaea sp.]